MKGEDLPKSDNIVRYIKPSMIQEDGTADGSNFRLRSSTLDEVGVSVNWLEALEPELNAQLSAVRALSRIQLRRNGRFAQLNVGTVFGLVAEELETLSIVHDPLTETGNFDADPSHSLITGLPPGDSDHAMLIGDLIADCVIAMHPALV